MSHCDPLLWGTEAPICQLDQTSREICCLLGARIRVVVEGLPKLIRPSDYYPLLLFHVGTNDTATENLDSIKSDYRALGPVVKGMRAQVVFSSILPSRGKGARRRALIGQVNNWLQNWCWRPGFGSYDHRTLFTDQCLFGRDGILLTKKGKAIFTIRMADFIRKDLN